MKAYLAILRDSFREAAASMVMWLALGGILLLLLALLPIGLLTAANTELRHQELVDPEKLAKALYDGRADAQTPEGHIWTLLNEKQRERLVELTKSNNEASGRRGQPGGGGRNFLVNSLNQLLKNRSFYNPAAFNKVELDEELRKPDAESLPVDELSNRNLRRVEKAFASYISVTERSALSLTYAGFEVIGPLAILPSQIEQAIDGYIATILYLFFGIVGIFVSLLFTATLIPRTFEPGEISLLLSKPVHRAMLFLTKFLGGCVFTLICATLLVTGIWLLLGMRLDIWRPQLLWCIPLYVFLFSIYFSVSALAGAIWRNAIVSLILVILFWLGLTLIGLAHGTLDELVVKNLRVSEISSNGGEVFGVDGERTVHRWDEETGDWLPLAQPEIGEQIPTFVRRFAFSGHRLRISVSNDGKRILALQPTIGRFGVGPATILSGNADEQFELQAESQTPEAMFGIFQTSDGDVILPGSRGIYRFVGQTQQERKVQTYFKGILGGLMPSVPTKAFENLTEKGFPPIAADSSVAFNPTDNSLLALHTGEIRRIDRTADGKYAAGETKDLQWKESAILAVGGKIALIARADGKVMAVDATTFDVIAESMLPDGQKPRVVECASDASSATVLTHHGTVLVFDGKSRKFLAWAPRESGYASAIAYNDKSQLMVVDHHRGVSTYDVATQSSSGRLAGSAGFLCHIYDYIVSPLYNILPKPGELNNAVQWILSGEQSVAISGDPEQGGNPEANLEAERVTFNVWNAIFSNVAFIVVMLGLGCLYIARSDF
ncbi:MAG: ABC transporter permease subunit [Fuerstia sp.]|nr:ABC transporter permease subunit [Fuerstiella sp.]